MASRWYQASEQLSRWAVQAGGALLFLTVLMVTIDVVGRKYFQISLLGTDEISGYIFGISTAWALSYALFRRRHIRIDALYVHLPYPAQRALDVIALVSFAVLFSLLAYQAVGVLLESLRLGAQSNTPLRTPLWIPQLFWMLGLCFFTFNIYLILIETITALLKRDFVRAHALAAAPSVRDEAAQELDQAIAGIALGEKGNTKR